MKRSTDRILTTHTGSLPRPPELIELLYAREEGRPYDQKQFDETVRQAVHDVVRKQIDVGVDVLNDGEQSKLSYFSYVEDRLDGLGGRSPDNLGARDLQDFPDFNRNRMSGATTARVQRRRQACIGPLSLRDENAVFVDTRNLAEALAGVNPADVFMSAASPGVLSLFIQNQYYPSHEAYLYALADVMKPEYDAIAQAGFLLQVDCPDFAMGYNTVFKDQTVDEFRKTAQLHLEVLNHATRDVPAEQLRMHICWGNYEGPHHHDLPLASILDLILEKGRATAVSFEGANPRHEHEYIVFDSLKIPDGKIIMPGVLDSTTNFIEHPELIAQRIIRYAERVGRENVIPGTDCGFSTGAGMGIVDPAIAWAKFESLSQGARIASDRLWS